MPKSERIENLTLFNVKWDHIDLLSCLLACLLYPRGYGSTKDTEEWVRARQFHPLFNAERWFLPVSNSPQHATSGIFIPFNERTFRYLSKAAVATKFGHTTYPNIYMGDGLDLKPGALYRLKCPPSSEVKFGPGSMCF